MADERALLTCYNDPLAAGMRAQLPDDERLVIGGFLRVAFELDGMPPLPIPSDADHEWWTTDAVTSTTTGTTSPNASTSFESTIASNATLVGLVVTAVRIAKRRGLIEEEACCTPNYTAVIWGPSPSGPGSILRVPSSRTTTCVPEVNRARPAARLRAVHARRA